MLPQCDLLRKKHFSRVFVQTPAGNYFSYFAPKKNPLRHKHDLSIEKNKISTFWENKSVNRYIGIICLTKKPIIKYLSFSQCWKTRKKPFWVFFITSVGDEVKGFFFRRKNPLSNRHDFTTFSNVILWCYYHATKIEQKVKGFFCLGVHPHTQNSMGNLEICKIVR